MPLTRVYDLHRYVSEVESIIKDAGLTVEISNDFFAYREYRMNQADRPPIPAMFDIASSFIAPENAFWIKITNDAGKIVHSQAIRLMPMSEGATLNDHVAGSRLIYAPPELLGEGDVNFKGPEVMQRISGQIAYHGEAWTESSLRRVRRGELSLIFGRLGVALARMFWPKLDCSFAFMCTSHVLRGLHARAGFANMEACTWKAGKAPSFREWLVWIDKEGIDNMLSYPPEKLSLKEPAYADAEAAKVAAS